MARRVSIVLFIGVIALFMASCGQTYELQSIAVTPAAAKLVGSGATQTFVVTATYTNTKTGVVTTRAKYQINESPLNATNPGIAPMSALNVNASGLLEVIAPACTFVPVGSGTATTYGAYPYTLVVSYTENSKTVTGYAQIGVVNTPGCNGTT